LLLTFKFDTEASAEIEYFSIRKPTSSIFQNEHNNNERSQETIQHTHTRMMKYSSSSMMPASVSRRFLVVITASLLLIETPITVSAYVPVVSPSARTTARRTRHSDRFSRHGVAAFLQPKDVTSEEPTNEWGIPNSTSLPPLASNRMPVPAALPNGGRVTMVGSGPGDPELLTVAAYKLLTENPDALVIVDRLVSPEILALIKGEVKIARKMPGCADLAQEEIYWLAYQALNQGKHVIRLKIGDPFVFGRGGEEVLTFRKFGLEAAVIPVSCLGRGHGISSGFRMSIGTHTSTYILFYLSLRVFRRLFRLHFWVRFQSLTAAFRIRWSCVRVTVVKAPRPT
jgi:hypothetical protein